MKNLILLTAVFLAGCAAVTNPSEFYQRKASLNDTEVCKTLLYAQENKMRELYISSLDEALKRNHTSATCRDKIDAQRALFGSLAVAGTVAAVVAVNQSANQGYALPPQSVPTQDFDWAWDEFYNDQRQLIWMCRGIQTGQFAPDDKCRFKLKSDFTWPSKEAIK